MENLSLTKIAKVVKSELFLIVIAIVSISLFLLFVFTFKSKNNQPKTENQQVSWRGQILPGQTDTKKLNSIVGNPAKIENSTYYYSSTNPKRPHQVEVAGDKVALIKEQVIGKEKGLMKDYIASLGQPEAIVYGNHDIAAPGHFWGNKGIIVFGNDNSGLIIEIWYFEPTTLDEFLAKHPDLKKEPAKGP